MRKFFIFLSTYMMYVLTSYEVTKYRIGSQDYLQFRGALKIIIISIHSFFQNLILMFNKTFFQVNKEQQFSEEYHYTNKIHLKMPYILHLYYFLLPLSFHFKLILKVILVMFKHFKNVIFSFQQISITILYAIIYKTIIIFFSPLVRINV